MWNLPDGPQAPRPWKKELVDRTEEAWQRPQADWARKRLLVVGLIALHQSSVAEIMVIAGVCRQTVFTYRDKVVAGRLLKAPHVNRLSSNLRQLEDHLAAVAGHWTEPGRVRSLFHGWMREQTNAGAPP